MLKNLPKTHHIPNHLICCLHQNETFANNISFLCQVLILVVLKIALGLKALEFELAHHSQ